MYTQHHIRTTEYQPNIPLLDREFDEKSPELADFIFTHAQIQNEDYHALRY